MSEFCVCDEGLSNLGTPSCNNLIGRLNKLAFTNLKDSTGAYNKIPAGTSVDQAYFDALVKNTDVTKRLFISPKVKDFLSPKGDPTYKTYDDGERIKLRDGLRSFTGILSEADATMVKYLNQINCAKTGFYLLTKTGSLVGYSKDGSGDIYPIPVSMLTSVFNFETGDDVQNVNFALDIPLTVIDSKIAVIYNVEADIIDVEGLIQLKAVASTPSALGYKLTLNNAGAYGSNIGYTGLLVADLVAYNVTTASSATVASVTSTAVDGEYLLTFTGAVATDIIRVSESSDLLDAGFSFHSVELAVA